MPAPINVLLENPTISVDNWPNEAQKWKDLNQEVGGNPDFYPLTIKAAYVIGIAHDICESVSHLLSHPNVRLTTYLPAFGIFSSGIEILGRCIRGNSTLRGSVSDLTTGYKWLASSDIASIDQNCDFITTSQDTYKINRLTHLRHFSAHGQATGQDITSVDFEILEKMPPLIADGLERYWNKLQDDEALCNNLALANIIPLRGWPVVKSWILFERDREGRYHSITEIFNRFDWCLPNNAS